MGSVQGTTQAPCSSEGVNAVCQSLAVTWAYWCDFGVSTVKQPGCSRTPMRDPHAHASQVLGLRRELPQTTQSDSKIGNYVICHNHSNIGRCTDIYISSWQINPRTERPDKFCKEMPPSRTSPFLRKGVAAIT